MSSNILPIQGLKAMRVLRDKRIYYIRERLLIILPASNVSSNTKFAVNPQMFQDNCSKMTRDKWILHMADGLHMRFVACAKQILPL